MELKAKSNQSQWSGQCRSQCPNFDINAHMKIQEWS